MVKSDPARVNIQIGGNVDGNIVVGENNLVVNTNHGTIVYKQAAPQVRARGFVPQPPRAPRGFLNRAAELGSLEAWISANEMVVIHAPDGMGKSSLLRQAAAGQAGHARSDGVILLEGVSVNDEVLGPNDVIQSLFDALFESDPPLKVDALTARTYLSNTRPLLLFDEVPLSPALQNTLPDLFPNGAMIFTSDINVGRQDFLRLPIGPLPREAAVRLLVNKTGVEYNPQSSTTFDALCALLEDISLAVVITGNAIRETGSTLEESLDYFQGISRSGQTGLDRAFSFAYNCLQPAEREILSAAALTPGVSMSPQWLVTALGSHEAEHFIARLKAMELLVANSPRLRLPPGIRIPAQRAATLDEDTLLRRLADFLLASVQQTPQNWELFEEELGNFFGVLIWSVRTNNWRLALRLGRALDPFLALHGLWDAWRDTLEFLLEAARRSGNRAAEAFVLHQSGVREIGVGTRQKALDFLYQALQIRQALGDAVGMAYTQHNIDLLIGPPPPPRNQQPEPQPPAPAAAMPVLVAGTLGVMGMIGLGVLLYILSVIWPPVTPTQEVPLPSTGTPTVTPTDTPTPTPTPTPTLTLTPSATQVIPVLAFNLAYSLQSDTAFLYQGFNSDYFEVPVLIRIHNPGIADINAFNISIHYEAFDGIYQASFRYSEEAVYSPSHPENGIATGQLYEREAKVVIPRRYEDREIVLIVQADRCQTDLQCTLSSLSYSLPLVVYDFIDAAPSVSESRSVKLQPGLKLEDGFQPEYGLINDTAGVTGYFIGTFDLRAVQLAEGDRLFARVGFLDGAVGNGATFQVVCYPGIGSTSVRVISFNYQGGGRRLAAVYDSYDRIVRGLNVILPTDFISGGCRAVQLIVAGDPASNTARAVWVSAYVARYRAGRVPPPPAPSTLQPATITPSPTRTITPFIPTPSRTLTPFPVPPIT